MAVLFSLNLMIQILCIAKVHIYNISTIRIYNISTMCIYNISTMRIYNCYKQLKPRLRMKKLNLLFAIIIGLFISSCSSSENNETENPTEIGFNIENNFYETQNGYFAHQSTDGTGFLNIIILTDGNLQDDFIDANDIMSNKFSNNTNNLIAIWLNSNSKERIEEGTYSLDDSQFMNGGFVTWIGFLTNIELNNSLITNSTNNLTSNDEVNPGNLIVTKVNNIYTFEYTYTLNGKVIIGTYTGELSELTYTEN
jgi:hypothetical protein